MGWSSFSSELDSNSLAELLSEPLDELGTIYLFGDLKTQSRNITFYFLFKCFTFRLGTQYQRPPISLYSERKYFLI